MDKDEIDFIKKVKAYDKKADVSFIKKAYQFSEKYHKGQKRATGEPFIEHPLNTAKILAGLHMDTKTIAAALLHDVVEDTPATIKEVEEEFGEEVACLVEGVTKIHALKNMSKEERHAETIRKVILASIKDIRVVLIKLADRVQNMETVHLFHKEKKERIARDALEIYAPIAHKLGMASFKWKLEDMAFKILNEKEYNKISLALKQSQKNREKEVKRIQEVLDKELKETTNIKYELTGRPKHVYSIHRKMFRKNLAFEDILDLRAFRVITDTDRHCYEILGIIHSLWTPIPKEFDDYIANPKSNRYQSLHTAVIGPTDKPVEVQIRTQEMHKIAEEGIAAHWKYKGHKANGDFEKKINWMRQISEWQKDSEDAKDFLKMLHIDFFEDEMFIFTPKGRVIELPKGATVLDFAFGIHTDIGMHCVAAKVNGHFVPIRWELQNSDLVDIITSKTQHPSREWLKIVKTSKAATKIKQFIRKTQEIPVKSQPKVLEVKKQLEAWIIDVDNMIRPEINLSKCCKPLPGDKIVGYATKTDKVSIHKSDCALGKKYTTGSRKKSVNVQWMDEIKSIVELKVDATERIGLFAEILNALIALKASIKHANAKPIGDDLIECSFTMEIYSIPQLQDTIKRIGKIKNVKHVYIGSMTN
ncbi:MAG: bifunctional (p)ppGpp synthetase/guanosine-3',5'-bis(diphosphate) 3'-pyrophosphohydrolase [Nanoarchaeota archaeon]|nr:bifunctional (p)ppGpp synthetase/guanosine-3',5'-bis(diphosphate) 3'-pyrophosphohydrolase [Nanoarchaeota archaeon]